MPNSAEDFTSNTHNKSNDGQTTQRDFRSVDMASDKTGGPVQGDMPPHSGYDGLSSLRQKTDPSGYDQTSYSKTTSKARRKILIQIRTLLTKIRETQTDLDVDNVPPEAKGPVSVPTSAFYAPNGPHEIFLIEKLSQ